MRKIILALLGAIAMSSTYAQNWLPIRYENQNVKGIPFSKVRFKKGETKETIFGKDMQVTLSEKPDGVESGYYVVHARNGYIAIGDKKNKIEVGSDKQDCPVRFIKFDKGKAQHVSIQHVIVA